MISRAIIDPAAVRALAGYADLPLAAGRERDIAPILAAWIADAEALSRKMSAPEYSHLVPVTVFGHPGFEDRDD